MIDFVCMVYPDMSNTLVRILLATLLVFAAPDSVGICKWVDKDGVVHYAETCPEDTDSSEVRIEPPPPQEQIDATAEKAEKLRSEVRARSKQRDQDKDQKTREKQDAENLRDAQIRQCAEARWNLEVLRKQLPVYYDDENQLHFNRSVHHYWYEGQRTYLDDQRRAEEILRYARIEEQTCTESEADIRDRIRIYLEKRDGEVCRNLRSKLANLKKVNTGIPPSEMRELEEIIATRCRQAGNSVSVG